MEKIINSEYWNFLTYTSNKLNELGVNLEDLKSVGYHHLYHKIIVIETFINGLNEKDDESSNKLKSLCHKDGDVYFFKYEVYETSFKDTESAIKILMKEYKENPYYIYNLEKYNVIFETLYNDDEGKTFDGRNYPKGYIKGRDYILNKVTIPTIHCNVEDLDSLFSSSFNFIVSGENVKINNLVKNCEEKVAQKVIYISSVCDKWANRTKEDKVEDVYVSFALDEITKYVSVNIQKIPSILTDDMKEVVIGEGGIKPSDWFVGDEARYWENINSIIEAKEEVYFPLENYNFIRGVETTQFESILRAVNSINRYITKLLKADNYETEYGRIYLNRLFISGIGSLLIRGTRLVWKFSDRNDLGRSMVDNQVSIIINKLSEFEKENGKRLYLDLSSMITHYKVGNMSSEKADEEHQFIRSMFGKYTQSFSSAVQTKLLNTQSLYFAPLVSSKLADDKSVNVIKEEVLLAQENAMRT